MSIDNQVSVKLSAGDIEKIDGAIKTINSVLDPYLVTISTDERKELPKMNEKNVPFVKKVLEYAESHPEFAPAYLNISNLKIDVEGFAALNKIEKPLSELAAAITDTTMVCGSEAYTTALTYYNSVKQAVKMKAPGAKVIFDDLKKRFEDNAPRNTEK